ncbi:MAG: hypothetical protein HEP71_11185 [Roseivirga sp.]|nr:hypothetical protein [Roseivirga sp.]
MKKITFLLALGLCLSFQAISQTGNYSEVQIKKEISPKLRFRNHKDEDPTEYKYWDIQASGSSLKFRYAGPTTSTNPSMNTFMTLYAGVELDVDGKIFAEEIEVKELNLPDYVFERNYDLMNLMDLKLYVNKNHHLPGVPTAVEVRENGMALGDMVTILLKKVEELTLYTIAQEEKIKALEVLVSKDK